MLVPSMLHRSELINLNKTQPVHFSQAGYQTTYSQPGGVSTPAVVKLSAVLGGVAGFVRGGYQEYSRQESQRVVQNAARDTWNGIKRVFNNKSEPVKEAVRRNRAMNWGEILKAGLRPGAIGLVAAPLIFGSIAALYNSTVKRQNTKVSPAVPYQYFA